MGGAAAGCHPAPSGFEFSLNTITSDTEDAVFAESVPPVRFGLGHWTITDTSVSAVPEPGSVSGLLAGILAAGLAVRKKRSGNRAKV